MYESCSILYLANSTNSADYRSHREAVKPCPLPSHLQERKTCPAFVVKSPQRLPEHSTLNDLVRKTEKLNYYTYFDNNDFVTSITTAAPVVSNGSGGSGTRPLSVVQSFDLSDESVATLLRELKIEERIVDAARRMADMPARNRKEKQQRRQSLQQ